MTPEERQQFEEMQRTLRQLLAVEDVAFIENIKRRLDVSGLVSNAISQTELNDLADVDTTGVSNGQVIKYTSATSTWENANDIDT